MSAPANTPASNTGGIPKGAASGLDPVWEDSEDLVSNGEQVWLKCKERQSRGLVHIDWLSFTVRPNARILEDTARSIATELAKILGGSLESGNGANFYSRSVKVVSDETMLAAVYFGGTHQKDTIHVSLPGAAWLASDGSLNKAMYELMLLHGVEFISRIDICRDCFADESSFKIMQDEYSSGNFKPSRGVSPSIWTIQDERRGSTCHIGRRENGKLIRGYEKSMQLARKQGWFRVELELRSVNRRIPLEAVIDPAAFFAGASKHLADLADSSRVERVTTFQKSTELSIGHMQHYARIGYGKFVKFLADAGVTPSQIVEDLTTGVSGLPRRLRIGNSARLLEHAATLTPVAGVA